LSLLPAAQSRVERRYAAVVHDGDFRAVIDQVLDYAGPAIAPRR